MEHEGDVSLLVRLAQGEGRIGVFACTGGNRGAIGAGQASALETWGLQKNLTVMSGASAGLASVAYLSTGTLSRARRIFWREGASRAYVSFSPQRLWQGTTADVGHLVSVFRGEIGNDALDLSALRACRADVCGVVVDYETAEGRLIDLKKTPDPIAAIHASIAMAHLYRRPVYVEGRRCFDGVGMPLPAEMLARQWGLDGLIVFANRPKINHWSLTKRMLESIGVQLLPKHLRLAARRRHAEFEAGIAFVRRNLRHLILWTDDSLSFIEQDPAKIEAASHRGCAYMSHLCVSAGL